jgi:hypothetical protein
LGGRVMWELSEHVCRVCLGRVLRRRDSVRGWVNRCADCGEEVAGGVTSLCVCGATFRTGKNAGLRCVRHQPTPESPSEIIVSYVGVSRHV